MPKQKQTKARAHVPSRAKRYSEKLYESDSTYFLKLVACVILGTIWVRLGQPISWLGIPISGFPIGMLVGLILVRRFEKHQSDRKIWYAILLVVAIISNFVASGIVI